LGQLQKNGAFYNTTSHSDNLTVVPAMMIPSIHFFEVADTLFIKLLAHSQMILMGAAVQQTHPFILKLT